MSASVKHKLGILEPEQRKALRSRNPMTWWDFWDEANQTEERRARFHHEISAWFWLPGSVWTKAHTRIAEDARNFILPERRVFVKRNTRA